MVQCHVGGTGPTEKPNADAADARTSDFKSAHLSPWKTQKAIVHPSAKSFLVKDSPHEPGNFVSAAVASQTACGTTLQRAGPSRLCPSLMRFSTDPHQAHLERIQQNHLRYKQAATPIFVFGRLHLITTRELSQQCQKIIFTIIGGIRSQHETLTPQHPRDFPLPCLIGGGELISFQRPTS